MKKSITDEERQKFIDWCKFVGVAPVLLDRSDEDMWAVVKYLDEFKMVFPHTFAELLNLNKRDIINAENINFIYDDSSYAPFYTRYVFDEDLYNEYNKLKVMYFL